MFTHHASRIKRTPDGRVLLNLGCGAVTHPAWNNLDFGPYATLKRRPIVAIAVKLLGLMNAERRQRLAEVDPEIIAWDVRKPLPLPAETCDVVYHSNLIEHLTRTSASLLIQECFRILKRGGILRVVTPDTELLATEYLRSLAAVSAGASGAVQVHEETLNPALFTSPSDLSARPTVI